MSFRSLMLLLALCSGAPAAAAAQDARKIELAFEISWAGLPGFRIDVAARLDGNRYDVESHTFKEGLIKALTIHYIGRNRAWGYFDSKGAQPAGGSLSLAIGDKVRTWLAQYPGNGSVLETHNPEWKPPPHHAITDEQRRGALDPLTSAMFAAFAGPAACDRTIPSFDGRRRIDVILTKIGTDKAENTQAPGAHGEAIVCAIHTRRVAGEFWSKEDEAETDKQRAVRIWLARLDNSSIYFPARLEAQTAFGTVRGKVLSSKMRPLTEEERVAMRR